MADAAGAASDGDPRRRVARLDRAAAPARVSTRSRRRAPGSGSRRGSARTGRGRIVIRLDIGSFTHAGSAHAVLRDVDLTIDEGELCLVIGPTGSGKSTLLGTINGLVPHFTGGHLVGRVTVDGRDTRVHKPRDMAETVGYVGQDPLAGFVTDTVEEELAYAMEQLGLAPDVMRKRVEETLDLLGIAELRARALRTLSG